VVDAIAAHDRSRDRWFFTGMAVAAAATVFAGFAPTYFLRGVSAAPPLAPLLHAHGFVFTCWIALFLAQVLLVAARRTDIHRKLGIAGAVLAVAMLAIGFLTAVDSAKRGVTPFAGLSPLTFLAVPLGDLVVFAGLIGAGLYWRRRGDAHKRLMLLATIGLLTPAIARLPFVGAGGPAAFFGLTDLFVVACIVYDRVGRGRVHPAFLWGGLYLVVSQPLRLVVGSSEAWLAVARWLTGS
jgi:hypothetical protein